MYKILISSVYFYFLCISTVTMAQRGFKQENRVDGISIVPSIGMGSVVGELGDIFCPKPVYGLNIDKGVSEKVNIGVGVVGGNLLGSEENPYFSVFRTDYFQIETLAILNISRYFFTSYNRNFFELKFYGGFGMIWFHTDVFDSKSGVFLRATSESASRHTALFQPTGSGIGETGIYYTRELIVPFGFKMDYKINEHTFLNFDVGYNWVNNDKLDGTTPHNILNPNNISGVNSYSNTPNDGWVNFSLGLRYTFSFDRTRNQRGV